MSQAPFAPFQSFPPYPASPSTCRTHQGRLYGRGSGLPGIFSGFGGGAPHLQSHWTFSIKLLTFSGLKCTVSLYLAQTLPREAKRARGCQNCRKFFFQHQRCSKITQVLQPDLATPNQAAPPWGVGERERERHSPPPQCHFPEDTIKELIIVFQN